MQKTEVQIIFYLLKNKENVGKTIREIAVATGVSVGSVHNTLTDLTNRGYIVDDGKSRLLRKRQSLIDRWAQGYADSLSLLVQSLQMHISQSRLLASFA